MRTLTTVLAALLCAAAAFAQQPATRAIPLRGLRPAGAAPAPAAGAAQAPQPARAQAQEDEEPTELAADVAAALEAALGTPGSGPPDALYAACCTVHGSLDLLFVELDAEVEESSHVERSAEARRLRAWLRWRDGDLRGALSDFGVLAEAEPDGEAGLARARLLDATGEAKEALAAYGALVDALAGTEDEGWLRIRMALMEMEVGGEESQSALADYASREGSDPELRNRAAVVLALLGRPGDAIDLYVVPEDDKGRHRGQLRVAEWAIRAERYADAQEAAWRAVQSASLSRDRRYALAVLVEAHRKDETEAKLIERLAAQENLSADAQRTWIALLRETDRYDEAITLFQSAGDGRFDAAQRLELLEMYRQAGREEEMLAAYDELIAAEPAELAWREGLSRYFLERGEVERAHATWEEWLGADGHGGKLLDGARTLEDLGLDGFARRAGERSLEVEDDLEAGLLFLYALERNLGRLPEAAAVLRRLDEQAPADSAVRYQLSECWEQLGDHARAAATLEGVVEARGQEEAGEDVAMRLAWLYSELGDEDRAMEAWTELAERVKSVPRLRYVEDRMMTVASRLGRLADIAVDLETSLMAGEADERQANLLVRLYTKVNDSVSAAEVIEEFLKTSGKSEVEALQEKARVYMTCADYYFYEKTVAKLMEVDPEGKGDYLRQLAMSQLERGKPDEARATLKQLEGLEEDAVSAEFEAGVLTIANMRDEAIAAYRKGVAAHPERIDSYLLMANLMREVGNSNEAVGMFQYLTETCEKDDLFTVSIDGLLNQLVDAPPRPKMLAWARRQALERLALREDKPYLYQLIADLAEEAEEPESQLDALEYSLASAGTRRSSILRELMELSAGGASGPFGFGPQRDSDEDRQLVFGRRLLGLAELVPPDVFLDLGEAFLKGDDVASAVKTFDMARDLPDPIAFRRQTAALLETSGYVEEGLDTYSKVLATNPTDVGLIVKVAELEEALAKDERARPLYGKALELLLSRKPLVETDAVEEEDEDNGPRNYFAFSRNVNEYDRYHERALVGWLASTGDLEGARADLSEWRERATAELDEAVAELQGAEAPGQLEQYPRIAARAALHRRMALSLNDVPGADEMDRALLARFPDDSVLLEAALDARVRRGLTASATALIEGAELEPERRAELLARAGATTDEAVTSAASLPLSEGLRQLLPHVVAGDRERLALLVRRIDLTGMGQEELPELTALFSAARWSEDEDLVLFVGREWVRHGLAQGQQSYELQQTLSSCGGALSAEGRRSLYQYFIGLILEDEEKGRQFISMLPQLSEEAGGELLTPEQVAELLDGYGQKYAYGLGPVLALLDEKERAGALRGIWPKLEKTRQASFLIDLVTEMKEGVGEGLGEFIVEAFPDALEEADDFLKYSISELGDAEANHEIILRMTDALQQREPDSATHRSIRALALDKLERVEEALELAPQAWLEIAQTDTTDYYVRRAGTALLERFVPEHKGVFLAAAAAAMGEDPTEELALAQLDLARRCDDDDALRAALAQALEAFPEEPKVLEQAQRTYNQLGERVRGLEALQTLVDLPEEKDEKVKRQRLGRLLSGWRGLENWARALEVAEVIDGLEGDDDEGGPLSVDEQIQAALAAGATSISIRNNVVFVDGSPMNAGGKEKLPKSIQAVKSSLEDERQDDARATLRRLWRNFKEGEATDPYAFRGFGSYSPMYSLSWPADAAAEDDEPDPEEEAKREAERQRARRGGLDAFRDEDPEKPEPAPSAYERLAEHPALVEELERFLRTRQPRDLSRMQSLLEGLLAAQVAERGVEGALADLLGAARAGTGGKAEAAMLLALLDQHPELLTADVEEHLAGLVRGVDPKDAVQVRRLARVWARAGRSEDALRLYRWCATRVSGGSRFYFGPTTDDGSSTVSANELVEEAKEVLDGEEQLAFVQYVLRFAKPPSDPWNRGYFERMVVDTWLEMVGPREALARCREVCEASLDLEGQGLQRDVAKRAAVLFAASGELDNAVRALEIGLCELTGETIWQPTETWYRTDPERQGSLNNNDLKDLFPKDAESLEDPLGWYTRAADALYGWAGEERLSIRNSYRAQALIAARLAAMGEEGPAQEILGRLGDASLEDETAALWVADAARRANQAELARRIETRLLERGELRLGRLGTLLAEVQEAEGSERTLELGERAFERTRSEDLLQALVKAAEAAEDQDALARWSAEAAASAEAKAALEARDERLKEEAKAKAEAAEAGR